MYQYIEEGTGYRKIITHETRYHANGVHGNGVEEKLSPRTTRLPKHSGCPTVVHAGGGEKRIYQRDDISRML